MFLDSGARNLSSAYQPKERGTLSVLCINGGDRNLLRDQEPIVCLDIGVRNLSSAYQPKERGTLSVICINGGERNLLQDQEPIVCLNSAVRNLYVHKHVELCESALE